MPRIVNIVVVRTWYYAQQCMIIVVPIVVSCKVIFRWDILQVEIATWNNQVICLAIVFGLEFNPLMKLNFNPHHFLAIKSAKRFYNLAYKTPFPLNNSKREDK